MAARRRAESAATEGAPGAPAWVFTWGNLATVMLAFFIVLYVTGGGSTAGSAPSEAGAPETAEKQPARAASISTVRSRIEAKLKAQGAESLVRFETSGGALVIHLDASALYDSGRAEIKPQAIPALDAIGSVLAGVGNQVRVEGHTDSDPVTPTPQFPDNWALSSARATGVLRYLREYHQIPSNRLSVAGYAHTKPVASNATPQGKAKNRRVDIVVQPR